MAPQYTHSDLAFVKQFQESITTLSLPELQGCSHAISHELMRRIDEASKPPFNLNLNARSIEVDGKKFFITDPLNFALLRKNNTHCAVGIIDDKTNPSIRPLTVAETYLAQNMYNLTIEEYPAPQTPPSPQVPSIPQTPPSPQVPVPVSPVYVKLPWSSGRFLTNNQIKTVLDHYQPEEAANIYGFKNQVDTFLSLVERAYDVKQKAYISRHLFRFLAVNLDIVNDKFRKTLNAKLVEFETSPYEEARAVAEEFSWMKTDNNGTSNHTCQFCGKDGAWTVTQNDNYFCSVVHSKAYGHTSTPVLVD